MAHYIESQGTHMDLPYVIIATSWGSRCGYVGVPETHPLFQAPYNEPNSTLESAHKQALEGPIGNRGIIPLLCAGNEPRPDVVFEIHGGLTFSGGLEDNYPLPDSPYWFFGFDCAHYGDNQDPEILAKFTEADRIPVFPGLTPGGPNIRSHSYVVRECKHLAEQLAAII